MPEVSIVILAKNEEGFIDSTLKAVYNQEIDSSFEVIVIDSGSRDRTLSIIQRYPVRLLQISPEDFGHGRTRNLGVSLAQGNFIIFLNADATPVDKGWLVSMVNSLSDDKVAGVYSRILPRPGCNPLDKRDILNDNYLFDGREKYIKKLSEYNKFTPERKRKFISFHTISCAIKKSVLLDNMFADIEFGEDLEWSKRMLEKGLKIIYEPGSVVVHSHNIHSSFINTVRKYFDDARLSRRLLDRWSVLNLLKWPAVIALESIKDWDYILKQEAGFIFNAHWIFYSCITRSAEFLGILLGVFPFLPDNLIDWLSLARQAKGIENLRS